MMISRRAQGSRASDERKGAVKCVVWDLDNTLWDGILLEDETVRLRGEAAAAIRELDARGILHSIASRNDFALAMQKLAEFGLRDYFLYPQVNWNSKRSSIELIAQSLNISREALAFVDDDPFERDEVSFSYPEVLCVDAKDVGRLAQLPEMSPDFITDESRQRRALYLSDHERRRAEEAFTGPQEDFLSSLAMVFDIRPAVEDDLHRVAELTERTHQLNSTGYTYSIEELRRFCQSGEHLLLVAGLSDKYGSYGKIGIALVECEASAWTIKLLLTSCRVVSRGAGTVMLNFIIRRAKERGVVLRAEFVPNGRNRMMLVTYRLNGFAVLERHGAAVTLENRLNDAQPLPPYIELRCPSA
jgi:FkbH-like protein